MASKKFAYQPTPAAWFSPENIKFVFGPQGGSYLGSDPLIPDVEAWFAPPLFKGAKVLMKDENETILRSNICLHRQVLLLRGLHGTLSNGHTTCSVHRWTYSRKGSVVGVHSGFCKESIGSLTITQIGNVEGYLFFREKEYRAMKRMFEDAKKFDPKLFAMERFGKDRGLVRVREYRAPYSPLMFVFNYLDVLHVGPAHENTFAEVADCKNMKWEFGDEWSMQVVPAVRSIRPSARGSWANFARKVYEGLPEAKSKPFALWGLVYPGGLMLELYFGHFLAVSYVIPDGPRKGTNIVEYYISDDAWADLGAGIIDDFIETYRSSADEDDRICEKMHEGLERLEAQGEVLHGPFHDPMEKGMEEWLEWLFRAGFRFEVKK